MSEESAAYGVPRRPRCESQGCITLRCEPNAPVKNCPSLAGCHEHAICSRCGFEWISAGEVPPALRTPKQIAISVDAAFEEIVKRRIVAEG